MARRNFNVIVSPARIEILRETTFEAAAAKVYSSRIIEANWNSALVSIFGTKI